jgi:hypothetical protein
MARKLPSKNISKRGPRNRRSLGFARDDKGKADTSMEVGRWTDGVPSLWAGWRPMIPPAPRLPQHEWLDSKHVISTSRYDKCDRWTAPILFGPRTLWRTWGTVDYLRRGYEAGVASVRAKQIR